MDRRKVVLTGLGVVSSVGLGAQPFWEALLAGRSGIRPIAGFEVADMSCRIAGQVHEFDPLTWLDKKSARRLDPVTQYAVAAGDMALADSGLRIPDFDPFRIGVILGTGIGGLHEIEEQARTLFDRGPGRVSPFFVPKLMANAASGELSIRYGARGPNFTTVSACASAAHAIYASLRVIQYGEADVVFTGGSEVAVTRLGLAGFCALRAVSTRNDDPARASRPFDRERDGFVMGDGAAVVVVEELEHARRRGAKIYAEILSVGQSADAHHITAPAEDGSGAAKAMELALREAGVRPDEIDYINAHGTSTEINDRMETRAIHAVFGSHAKRLAVSSTKSMIGHLLGAAGAVELVATALSVRDDRVPPTINYQNPDPDCDLDYVPHEARPMRVKKALSNSFGFGGHNAAVLVGKYEG